MDKNFKVRVLVGLIMFIVALIGLYTFDAVPFKIIFIIFIIIATIELFSFFKHKAHFHHTLLVIAELGFLFYGSIFVLQIDVTHFWYIILGVPGYDIFAYLFGKMLGGKIIKKSRPFPRISKNKTWEGTILGIITAISLDAILMAVLGSFGTDWPFLLCGPLALMGDLYESYLKRQFKVKDSNEIVIKNPIFEKLELLVGGSEGHGGFLDRVDSTVFASAVLLIVTSFIT